MTTHLKGEECFLAHSFKDTQSLVMGKVGRSVRLGGHLCGSIERGWATKPQTFAILLVTYSSSKSQTPRSSTALPISVTN